MPIQIIDNFDLTSAKPIDNRIVVGTSSFYVNRDLISHKYPGLRIWDLNDSIPYVWTGATWSNENSSGAVTSQGGTAGYISKFVGGGSIIANSIMFESTSKIGINTLSPSETLDVNGNVKATLFKGFAWLSGAGLSNINLGTNGSNLFAGSTIGLGNIQNGSSGQILVAGVSSPAWTNPSAISSGSSIVATENSSTADHYITFVSVSSGTTGIKTNLLTLGGGGPASNGGIRFKPSTSQLLMSSYWQSPPPAAVPSVTRYDSTAPVYSFYGDTDTGMYSSAPNEVSFSTGGSMRLKVNNTLVSVINSNFAVPVGSSSAPSFYFFGYSNTGLYRPGANQFGITINSSRALEINTSGTVKNFDFYSQDTANHLNIYVKNNGEMGFSNSLSTSYYLFSINSQLKMKITGSGIQLMKQSGIDIITPTFTLSGTSGTSTITNVGQSGGSYAHAYTEFDRYITVQMGSSGSGSLSRIYCAVEDAYNSGTYYVVERRNGVDAFTSTSFLVPAYCRFMLEVDFNGVAFSTQCSVKSRRFGVN